MAGDQASNKAGDCRRGDRVDGGVRPDAGHEESALPSERDRSGDLRVYRLAAGRGRSHCRLHPGAEGDESRSDGRSAARLTSMEGHTMLRKLFHRLRASLRRGKIEREMERELRIHLEMETEENIRRGMSEEEARRAALRSFGGVEQVKEAYRDLSRFRLVEGLWQDIRFSARLLLKQPGFLAVFGNHEGGVNLTGEGAAERIEALDVTANFFQTLGVNAIAGRL